MAFHFDKPIDYTRLPVNQPTIDKIGQREEEFMELWTTKHVGLGFGPMLIEWLKLHPEDLTA